MSHYVVTIVLEGSGSKSPGLELTETKVDLTTARASAIRKSNLKGVNRVVITYVTEIHEATYIKGEQI